MRGKAAVLRPSWVPARERPCTEYACGAGWASACVCPARHCGRLAAGSALLLAACSGTFRPSDFLRTRTRNRRPDPPDRRHRRSAPARSRSVSSCRCRRAAMPGSPAQSMRNAAEMALAEFNSPDIQLLVKDDGGSAPGAQQAAQQALDEGAEIILGPLFAHSVGAGRPARARTQRAGDRVLDRRQRGDARRLSLELPAGVRRRPHRRLRRRRRASARSPRSMPDNAYGTVVEAAFKQAVARRGGRVVALERYPLDRAKMQASVRNVAQAARPRRCDLHSGRRRCACRRWCRR